MINCLNAHKFNKYFFKAVAILSSLSVIFAVCGFYRVFKYVPDDYLQGELVKIMYIHVPFAWESLFLYALLALFSILYLIYLNPFYDIIAKAIAPVGMCFTLLALLTGAVWGKPAWGTWWVWDARLTSMLLLLFIYIAYMVLRHLYTEPKKSAQITAVFAIIGLINIPIIKFSVNIWNTLHQPSSVLRIEGPTIHMSMFWPLLITATSIFLYAFTLILLLIKAEINLRKAAVIPDQ